MVSLVRSCSRVFSGCSPACSSRALISPSTSLRAKPLHVAPILGQQRFATTVFNVKPRPGQAGAEQTLFVVGLNENKFFGQDGAEEGLKLLERIADHGVDGTQYNLLLGMSEREMAELEKENKVKQNRLTPSRELEGRTFGEFIPIVQASMVDRRPRKAVGRLLKITQGHVSWQLWRHPREAVKLYWTYWQRKNYKDVALRKFWMERLPTCAYAYFMEVSHLIAFRATSQMVGAFGQEKPTTWVLVVSNQLFEPTVERLTELLDNTAASKFESEDFARHLREQASELCVDAPDFTPLLIFFYVGFPVLVLQTGWLAIQWLYSYIGVTEMVMPPEFRE